MKPNPLPKARTTTFQQARELKQMLEAQIHDLHVQTGQLIAKARKHHSKRSLERKLGLARHTYYTAENPTQLNVRGSVKRFSLERLAEIYDATVKLVAKLDQTT